MPKAIKSPEQRKRKPKEVDNDKARKKIVRGTTAVSTDDANKANHDKTLNALVATSINSTTQSGTTIHTAGHVDVRTCISPTDAQQVMSSSDTTLGKNQSSEKNPETQSNLFDNNVKTDPARKNQPSGINPSDPSDVNNSIDLFGNDIEPDHVGKNQPSGKTPTDPSDVNDSIDLFGNDIEPDTTGKNQPSGINHGDPSDVNDSIDLPGNDIEPDHTIKNQPSGKNDLIDLFANDIEPDTTEKNQSSETNPSDTSDVNDSIAPSGNDVDPDHNLKISSTHATKYVDKPGKKQLKGKIPRTTSKVTSNDDISYNGLPEINHSDNPTGNESNTEKKRLEGATRNDNNAPTNVSNEDDNIEKANPLFAKPEVFVTKVVDVIVQIHMVEIALFLYGDNTTVVEQPLVNHRPLFVSNIKSRDFLDKMQSKSHDFGEEMHATVFEVRKKTNNEMILRPSLFIQHM
jgi:hypothetical protein